MIGGFRSLMALSAALFCLGAVADDTEKVDAFRIVNLNSDGILEFKLRQIPTITIEYGANLELDSLNIVLNGKDIRALFDPAENPVERVALPLPLGESMLEIDSCYYVTLEGEYVCKPYSISIKVIRGDVKEQPVSLRAVKMNH